MALLLIYLMEILDLQRKLNLVSDSIIYFKK